ncbi:MAG: hypothetical protein ABSC19_18225 [Syntrophorhabdales bacterium]|jgi:hypothetical protein
MNTGMDHREMERGPFTGAEEARPIEGILMGGSLAQTIAGAGAIVLSILGLLGMLPEALLAVSTIAVGAAFLMASGSIASRFNAVLTQITRTTPETGEMAIGMTTEFISGIAGIALGVLSLLGVVPTILLPVAAIMFGFTLLFGVGVQTRLMDLETQCGAAHEMARRVAREAASAGSGIQILLGLGAITLGIVSLVGVVPFTLTLVAMLSLGGATLFSGAAISARMWGFTRVCEMPPQPARP